MPAVVCSSTRWSMSLLCCAMGSAGAVSEPLRGLCEARYIDDASYCLPTSCPRHCATLFHQVAGFVLVSTDQRTGPSSYGVHCPSSGFLPFPLFTGVWQFSKFLGSAFPVRVCWRVWDLSHPACASRLPISFEDAPGSVPRKVLNPVVYCSEDRLMTSVVVQQLVPGGVSADNCGGSAVSWGLYGDSAGAVLGQVDTPVMCNDRRWGRFLCSSSSWTRSFTCPLSCICSTRWSMPLLCCGLGVQFIDGYDVPTIVDVQRSAPHLAVDSALARSSFKSCPPVEAHPS